MSETVSHSAPPDFPWQKRPVVVSYERMLEAASVHRALHGIYTRSLGYQVRMIREALAKGWSEEAIADAMQMSPATVRTLARTDRSSDSDQLRSVH